MSLILDALNRSRQDVGEVPGLESQHQLVESSPPGVSRWWLAALMIALAVIAFLVYERGGESQAPLVEAEDAAPVESKVAVVEQAVVKASEKPVIAPPPAAKDRLAPPQSPVKEKPDPQPDAAVAALYAGQPAPTRAAPKPKAEKVARPASKTAVTEESAIEQPVDIEAVMQQAQDELENARLDEHPAPFLASLSQQSKDRIPTIFYERHDYSGKPGRSSVVLNGKTLKPGGKTSAGVRVDEILPGSAVLSFQGTQFRLRALNSWVNL